MTDFLILAALSNVAELAWGKELLPTPRQPTIPVAFWRFRRTDPARDRALASAIKGFVGSLAWDADDYPQSAPAQLRNWFIAPAEFIAHHRSVNGLVLETTLESFSGAHPELIVVALTDYPRLAAAIGSFASATRRR